MRYRLLQPANYTLSLLLATALLAGCAGPAPQLHYHDGVVSIAGVRAMPAGWRQPVSELGYAEAMSCNRSLAAVTFSPDVAGTRARSN